MVDGRRFEKIEKKLYLSKCLTNLNEFGRVTEIDPPNRINSYNFEF